jgi:hypothetical protein
MLVDDVTDLAVGSKQGDDDEPSPSSGFVIEICAHLKGLRLQPTSCSHRRKRLEVRNNIAECILYLISSQSASQYICLQKI